ncbi:MAG TPA: hypothetical protein VN421_12695 [Pseudoflavonifractor sp.]|nr:hypothetical protein [Pseudoflavonifractor sp.]
MSKIQAVIFDWAGTTVDYGSFAPVKGFIDGFQRIGFDITSKMARTPMGLLKIDHTRAIAAMLPEPISEEQIQTAYAVFEETLFANIEEHCALKDFVVETVDALRAQGVKIGSSIGYGGAGTGSGGISRGLRADRIYVQGHVKEDEIRGWAAAQPRSVFS